MHWHISTWQDWAKRLFHRRDILQPHLGKTSHDKRLLDGSDITVLSFGIKGLDNTSVEIDIITKCDWSGITGIRNWIELMNDPEWPLPVWCGGDSSSRTSQSVEAISTSVGAPDERTHRAKTWRNDCECTTTSSPSQRSTSGKWSSDSRRESPEFVCYISLLLQIYLDQQMCWQQPN